MGVLRIIGIAFLAFLILIVGVPVLLFIAGLTAPLWGALYQASLHAFGSDSTLTWVVYWIYQFTQACNQYVVHYLMGNGPGGAGASASNNSGSVNGGCK
jgi:hypothetical protein